jgi:hypothetical protein
VQSDGTIKEQAATQLLSSTNWKRTYFLFRPTTTSIRIEFVIHNANIEGYIDNFKLEKAKAGQTTPTDWIAYSP